MAAQAIYYFLVPRLHHIAQSSMNCMVEATVMHAKTLL